MRELPAALGTDHLVQTARAGLTCALRCVEEKKDLLLVRKGSATRFVWTPGRAGQPSPRYSPSTNAASALAVIGADAKVHPYMGQSAISPGEDVTTRSASFANRDLTLVAGSAPCDGLHWYLVL
jgi:hypothetical protein